MTVASMLLALAGGASVATAEVYPYFSKIVEGAGRAKAIQVKVRADGRESILVNDLEIKIVVNGGTIIRTERLRRPGARLYDGSTVSLCTEEAAELDVNGHLCGKNPIILDTKGAQNAILKFNGNDKLVLRRRDRRMDVDVFGDEEGNDFVICGRKSANKRSILRRKLVIQQGNLREHPLQCEWDYEPWSIPFRGQEFSYNFEYDMPVSTSRIVLDRDFDVNTAREFYLSAPLSLVEKTQIKDMEKGQRQGWGSETICIKQDEYLYDQLEFCDYIWDAPLGSPVSKSLDVVPFIFQLSGTYVGDMNGFERYAAALRHNLLAQRECIATSESPIDTFFKDYVVTYNCTASDDCQAVDEQYKRETSCITKRENVWLYDPIEDRDINQVYNSSTCHLANVSESSGATCFSDDQCCDEREFCDLVFRECRPRGYLLKVRSTNANNLVIPAGESRAVNFHIDNSYLEVGFNGRIHVVTTTIPNLRYEVTTSPSLDLIGVKDTFEGSRCDGQVSGDGTTYYRSTTEITISSDDQNNGLWVYTLTNDGTEDVTLLGAFKDFSTHA